MASMRPLTASDLTLMAAHFPIKSLEVSDALEKSLRSPAGDQQGTD